MIHKYLPFLGTRVVWAFCGACLVPPLLCHDPQVLSDPPPPASQPATRPDGDGGRVGIIVDIDETISITDYPSLVFGVGTDESKPYHHAHDVLTELSREFEITYLTSRPQWLTGETRKWLAKHGFPAGTVLTTARMIDVYWPGPFKKRAIAALRRASPDLLIGIGDRHTDVEAYVGNNMLALVVNPRRNTVYHPRALVLQDWDQVRAFFENHAATLRAPRTLVAEYDVGGPPLDPSTIQTRPKVDWSLALEIPLFATTVLVEDLVKLQLAHQQTEARRAMALVDVPFAAVLDKVVARFGEQHVLELSLATEDDKVVYVVTYESGGKVYETELDTDLNEVEQPERVPFLTDDPVQARRLAQITIVQALAKALGELDGQVYEIELEMDDGRPTYEIALCGKGRFMEIEIDAVTGEILEIEDETAIRRAADPDPRGAAENSTPQDRE